MMPGPHAAMLSASAARRHDLSLITLGNNPMHARMLLMLMFMGLALPLQAVSQAEKHDRAIFVQPSNAFFDTITARLDRFARKEEPKK